MMPVFVVTPSDLIGGVLLVLVALLFGFAFLVAWLQRKFRKH